MSGLRVAQARDAHERMNHAFRARQLLDPRFYQQLESRSCQVSRCVLVTMFPDGGDTHVGSIIRQDGRVFDFDLALSEPAHSEWEDRTEEFIAYYERSKRSRPWEPTVVAYDLFRREREPGSV